jgi:hypothetical protein
MLIPPGLGWYRPTDLTFEQDEGLTPLSGGNELGKERKGDRSSPQPEADKEAAYRELDHIAGQG